MQIREYDYVLDIRKSNTYDRVELVQHDTQTNIFNITLKDDETIYNLDDSIVTIVFNKADRTVVTQSTEDDELPLTVTDNVIKCIVKTNTIAATGNVLAEIKVSDLEGKLLTSQRFEFRVRRSLLTDKAVESTNEFPLLQRLIVEANALNDLLTQNEIYRNEELQIKLIEFETALNNFINAQGNIIDNKLDEVNNIMLDVNILIGEVNDKLNDIDNKLDDVDNIVDGLITDVDNKIIDLNTLINDVTIAENERVLAEENRVTAEEDRVTEFAGFEDRIEDAEDEIVALKEDLTQQKVKVAIVEKELNDYKSTMASVNVNQEAKQSVSGYGIVSLPKNSANGQVEVSVKGNTVEGLNTISASKLKSVGKNLFDKSKAIFVTKHLRFHIYEYLQIGETYTISIQQNVSEKYFIKIAFSLDAAASNALFNINNIYRHTFTWTQTAKDESYKLYIQKANFTLTEQEAAQLIIQIEKSNTPTPYEPYTESTQYLPNVGELRSLPNGVRDEIRNGNLIKRIGIGDDDVIIELAEPIITPIQVSGNIVSYPSGTIYIDPVTTVAGVYASQGIDVTYEDLPIKEIEKISKVDFITGIETELDVSKATIAENKLSFTHEDLSLNDIVFFEYEYDVETTQAETTVEYYDSRYVLKDDVTGKYYKVVQTVTDGVLVDTLVEV